MTFDDKDDPLLNNKEATEYLGLKHDGTLAVWRSTKRYSLKWIKIGRVIRYRKSELDRFVAERTMQ